MIHPLFPDIDIPPHLFSWGFCTDNVYQHDSCVRLTCGNWTLWVDHVDPDKRELRGLRYAMHMHDDYLESTTDMVEFETDEDLLAYLEEVIPCVS